MEQLKRYKRRIRKLFFLSVGDMIKVLKIYIVLMMIIIIIYIKVVCQ